MAPSVWLQTSPTWQVCGQSDGKVQASSLQVRDPEWHVLATQVGEGHPRLSGACRTRLPPDAAKKSQVAAPAALLQAMGVANDPTVAPIKTTRLTVINAPSRRIR